MNRMTNNLEFIINKINFLMILAFVSSTIDNEGVLEEE